jgi:2'-5' RNA ligase
MAIQHFLSNNRQLDLLGGGVASTEVHRLFFALLPDAATRDRFAVVADSLKANHPALRAHLIKPDRYHATLHFLGDHAMLRPDLVTAAIAAADQFRAMAFEWTLDNAISFRGREPPCVLRCTEVPAPMQQLWQELGNALTLAGQGVHLERGFTPHVTLAYGRGTLLAPTAIEPVVWRAEDFALVHHMIGQGEYQLLGRWRLTAS